MNKREILRMLLHTDQETVYTFISTYAESNAEFCNQLKKTLLPGKTDELDKETYRAKAEYCFDFDGGGRGRRSYRYNFYQAAYDAALGLDNMLSDADYFIEQGEYAPAIEIAMSVAEIIPRNYESVDDSSGSLANSFNTATKSLVSILHNSQVSKQFKEEIYEWAKQEVNNSVYSDYGFDSLTDVYEAAYEELGETNEVLATLNKQIEKASEYQKERIILRKIRFMQSRNLDTLTFIENYLDMDSVRKIRFEQLKELGLYDEALDLARKGMKMDSTKNYWPTDNDWNKSIFEIYLLQEDVKNILFQAEKMLCESYYDHDKYYQIIKKYTNPCDWSDTLERILNSFDHSSIFSDFIANIMVEQQMWERLFIYCKKKAPIATLIEHYESYLKPHFEKEILNIYHNYVEEKALISHNSAYTCVARILKHMRTFDGGNIIVNQLLQEYRNTYKRRKNMMAALNNV